MTEAKRVHSLLSQFHATPAEMLQFIKLSSVDLGLNVALLKAKPFEVISIDVSHLEKLLDFSEGNFSRFALNQNKLNKNATSFGKFMDLNPNSMIIDVGCFIHGALNESSFSFKSDDEGAYLAAKKVANQIKKFTKSGAIAINPDTGVEVKIISHRYSEAAKKLADGGVIVLPVAGKSVYKLP